MESYELLEIRGEGTYGVVLKCRNRKTGELVAVKRFKDLKVNDYVRCTILRELKVEQLLRGQPYVVQLLEAFRENGRFYLVMEYIAMNLLDLLDANPHGLPLPRLQVLMYTILQGVYSCHRNGIIHRDIKPENILVRDNGTAYVCDFGFSRPMTVNGEAASAYRNSAINRVVRPSPTDSNDDRFKGLVLPNKNGDMTDYVATRWYRSPEMLLGMPKYDFCVDMWAVGCIMAEAASGQPLLPGKTEIEQLSLIQDRVGEMPQAYQSLAFSHHGTLMERKKRGTPPASKPASPHAKGAADSPYLEEHFAEHLGPQGMDLLTRLLAPAGARRITAEQAVRHPFFDEVAPAYENDPTEHSGPAAYPNYTTAILQSLNDVPEVRNGSGDTDDDASSLISSDSSYRGSNGGGGSSAPSTTVLVSNEVNDNDPGGDEGEEEMPDPLLMTTKPTFASTFNGSMTSSMNKNSAANSKNNNSKSKRLGKGADTKPPTPSDENYRQRASGTPPVAPVAASSPRTSTTTASRTTTNNNSSTTVVPALGTAATSRTARSGRSGRSSGSGDTASPKASSSRRNSDASPATPSGRRKKKKRKVSPVYTLAAAQAKNKKPPTDRGGEQRPTESLGKYGRSATDCPGGCDTSSHTAHGGTTSPSATANLLPPRASSAVIKKPTTASGSSSGGGAHPRKPMLAKHNNLCQGSPGLPKPIRSGDDVSLASISSVPGMGANAPEPARAVAKKDVKHLKVTPPKEGEKPQLLKELEQLGTGKVEVTADSSFDEALGLQSPLANNNNNNSNNNNSKNKKSNNSTVDKDKSGGNDQKSATARSDIKGTNTSGKRAPGNTTQNGTLTGFPSTTSANEDSRSQRDQNDDTSDAAGTDSASSSRVKNAKENRNQQQLSSSYAAGDDVDTTPAPSMLFRSRRSTAGNASTNWDSANASAASPLCADEDTLASSRFIAPGAQRPVPYPRIIHYNSMPSTNSTAPKGGGGGIGGGVGGGDGAGDAIAVPGSRNGSVTHSPRFGSASNSVLLHRLTQGAGGGGLSGRSNGGAGGNNTNGEKDEELPERPQRRLSAAKYGNASSTATADDFLRSGADPYQAHARTDSWASGAGTPARVDVAVLSELELDSPEPAPHPGRYNGRQHYVAGEGSAPNVNTNININGSDQTPGNNRNTANSSSSNNNAGSGETSQGGGGGGGGGIAASMPKGASLDSVYRFQQAHGTASTTRRKRLIL